MTATRRVFRPLPVCSISIDLAAFASNLGIVALAPTSIEVRELAHLLLRCIAFEYEQLELQKSIHVRILRVLAALPETADYR
ncbi:hypothetical protein H7I76_29885 [Mycolicibacterium vaccae]|nr:hypothetical protein [Mycolicibacterium vaccae]